MDIRLYVGNLPKTTTEEELKTLFAQAGAVSAVRVSAAHLACPPSPADLVLVLVKSWQTAGVASHLPALLKAQKVTEKAARVGFDWEHVDQVFAKVLEELHELEETLTDRNQERMEAELGDLLFAIVNLGRFLSVNPEDALRKTIARFTTRFAHVEETLHGRGVNLKDATLDEMEALWQEAKEKERQEV